MDAEDSSGPRLPHHPARLHGEERRPLSFTFNGEPVAAFEGDSIAAALYAGGRRIFTRSFKYHRPRGLLCCAGRCPNCMVNVDGTPNVRSCLTPARPGMAVTHQNAWPSLERDALSAAGLAGPLLPVGFYYKTLPPTRRLSVMFQHALKHCAGIGCVERNGAGSTYHHEYRTVDVAVVGGGPAGMAAALAAAQAGRRVTLLEAESTRGGSLRGDTHVDDGEVRCGTARHLAAELEVAEVDVRPGAVAFGLYEGSTLAVQHGPTLLELRYGALVLATGAYERPAVFPGNDLPGVMLGTGVQRLMRLYGVRPGQRAAVATHCDFGLELAEELLGAGVQVVLVADLRPSAALGEAAGRLGRHGVVVLPEAAIARAEGYRRLERAVFHSSGRGEVSTECDLLCLSLGWEPDLALLAHEGAGPLEWDGSASVFRASGARERILAAGSVTGSVSLPQCLELGRAAGLAAAGVAPGFYLGQPEAPPSAWLVSEAPGSEGGRRFACVCEDVTQKDLAHAIQEGFDHIETLKRYATASMGPCQGKMCRAAVSEICARYTGRTPQEVGRSKARPPAQPVTLGALAAGHAAPVRVTPMHHCHLALGARMTNLGEWKRPEVYTSAGEECRAVRERAGLIDVGTLGKLEVVGRDAGALLEHVYTSRFQDLKLGRTRYAVACDETGAILDDGTVSRLAKDRWFVTTTTSGVETIEQQLRFAALGTPGGGPMCAHVTNVTAGRAAVNLAGPLAREILAPLAELDLSPAAFPYLAAREGAVAGLPALLMRIGFVGELGYEIHFPAEYGAYLWETLLEAGAAQGMRPFGVEAQRILRLEKQHLIVSHDTDALSNPLDARMGWVVHFDKGEFTGRAALLELRERSGRPQLVGFRTRSGTAIPEGSQLVVDGRPAGRVTSFRQSPTLGTGIGLAWVPPALAEQGSRLEIAVEGGTVAATVELRPFFDPDGKRVRG